MLDPERAHSLASFFGKVYQSTPLIPSALDSLFTVEDGALISDVFGLDFANPVGLAAGFDKNAELVDFFAHLGFGFTEVGSVTAKPWSGNKKPRMFRLPDDCAIINRMGLNNYGAQVVASNLEASERPYPVGVNITKTADNDIIGDKAIEDILFSFDILYPSADYITFNISCPNTKDGKTFEDPDSLDSLLREMRKRESIPPVLVKISSDIGHFALDGVLDVGYRGLFDGLVVANTTSKRKGLVSDPSYVEKIGVGGLSGHPIRERSSQLIRLIYSLTSGRMPVIGVGGVDSAESAYDKIKSGASLVQLYTGMIYQGPFVARDINSGLSELLEKDGFKSVSEAVGVYVR
jgi:dihydroorotate dehydrogenase